MSARVSASSARCTPPSWTQPLAEDVVELPPPVVAIGHRSRSHARHELFGDLQARVGAEEVEAAIRLIPGGGSVRVEERRLELGLLARRRLLSQCKQPEVGREMGHVESRV